MNILLVTDCFLYYHFGKVLTQDIVDIIADTNPDESAAFVDSYLSPLSVIIWISLIVAFNIAIYYLSKFLTRFHKICLIAGAALTLSGVLFSSYAAINFIKYRNGFSVPQMTAPTRAAYSYYIARQALDAIGQLHDFTGTIAGDIEAGSGDGATIVFVIGESHSKAHTSLYGYEKDTYPLLAKQRDSGNLVVYDNVVTIGDHTHTVMHSLFSLNKNQVNFASTPLFPSIFKLAGYRSVMADNQYMAGRGISFLGSVEISAQNFDYRNNHFYKYDGMMIDDIPAIGDSTLLVCHLMGQHYTFADRYPASFDRFNHTMYKNADTDQNVLIAQYDNACLYNDYVLDRLLSRLKHLNAIVIYVSDHGEEVFEDGKSFGHGFASSSHNIDLQIRVPMFVWASDSYIASHPDTWQRITSRASMPLTTDDISHALIDISGIKTKWLDPSRSFVNPAYDCTRHRMVCHSIDYDARN